MRVSEIRVNQIRVNQGLGVQSNFPILNYSNNLQDYSSEFM